MRTITAAFIFACLLGTILLSGRAHGQTVDQKIISIRSPYVPGIVHTVTIQMEGGIVGRTLIGQSKKLTVDFFKDDKILVDFVGPKTSPTPTVPIVVTGLRVTVAVAGVPKVDLEPAKVHPRLDSPITLPLGTFVGCRYDMPPPTFDNLELVAAVTKWMATKAPFSITFIPVPGNLRCSVGIKAADIPAPPVVAGPVATGPITPALIGTGPGASVASGIADGATLSGRSIWVAAVTPDPTSVQFLVDGKLLDTVSAVPYTTVLSLLPNGPHQLEVKATYSDKSTKSAIVNVTVVNATVVGTPPPPPPPPPTTLSPDGTLVAAPDGVVRTAEGTWTFGPTTSGGSPLLLNGQNTGGGFGDKLLVKNGGKLYTFSRAGDWWAWSNGWTKMTGAP